MGGRNDFGVLRSDLLSDDRAHAAADLYAERGWARADLAVAMVAGHVSMLGLHAMRHTDDGVFPGDGVAFAHAALLIPRPTAREVVEILERVGLLKRRDAGLYLAGFDACYRPIVEARREDRERKALARDLARMKRDEQTANLLERKRNLEAIQRSTAGDLKPEGGDLADLPTMSDVRPSDIPAMSVGCPGVPTVPTVPYEVTPNARTRAPAREGSARKAGGGSASPRNGHPAAPDASGSTISSREARAARAMAAALLAQKNTPKEARDEARACLAALDRDDVRREDLMEFVRRHYGNTAARIAWLKPAEATHEA